MLTFANFTDILKELNELNSEIIDEENRILSCGLKKFDFRASASRLQLLIDRASDVHNRICMHLKQVEGRQSIEASVNYVASLIMTANEMMEISVGLDGKTKGIKFGYLKYRKKMKIYNQLCDERSAAASKLESIQKVPWEMETFKFMPQDVFNLCVVTAAKASAFTGKSIEQVSDEITSSYVDAFSDHKISKDVARAATMTREYISEYFPGGDEISKLTHLQFCIQNYLEDGQPKPKAYFSGTAFRYEKSELKQKPAECGCNLGNFILRTQDGTIPFVPDGWSL
ncbi:MAG: hypothetical protein GVY36_12455 [Verrucomicrobia bacterium]|jgi:N-acyl-D-aspartate/D-glutamate deacylase|nr:hypothetical protein [Verrucomicrobiota bacterium]